MTRKRFFALVGGALAVIVSFTWLPTANANPSSLNLTKGFAAHNTIPGAREMIDRLYRDYYEQEQIVLQAHQRAANNPSALPAKAMGKAYSVLRLGLDDIAHLQLMREPASLDLHKRYITLSGHVSRLALAYAKTAPGRGFVKKIKQRLARKRPEQERLVDQVKKLVAKGDFATAEQQALAIARPLFEDVVFLEGSRREQSIPGVGKSKSLYQNPLSTQRAKQYMEIARTRAMQQIERAKTFSAEADRLAAEIRESGNAKLGEDATGDAVEAFDYLTTRWGAACAAHYRASMLLWAFHGVVTDPKSGLSVNDSIKELEAKATTGYTALIEAATESISPEQVPSFYSRFLKSISTVQRRMDNDRLFKACEPSLSKLAAKAPGFSSQVTGYQQAVRQPLWWREQFATQQAAVLRKDFVDIGVGMRGKPSVKSTNVPLMFGNQPIQGGHVSTELPVPAHWRVYDAANALIGKSVNVGPALRVSPTSLTSVVPVDGYHYETVAVPLPDRDEAKDFAKAMVVSDEYPALSIDAANGISASEMQDYLLVGGRIEIVRGASNYPFRKLARPSEWFDPARWQFTVSAKE